MATRPKTTRPRNPRPKPTTPESVAAVVDTPESTETTVVEAVAQTATDLANVQGVKVEVPKTPEQLLQETPTPLKEVVSHNTTVNVTDKITIQVPNTETAEQLQPQPTVEGFIARKYGVKPEQYSNRLKQTIAGVEAYISNMNIGAPVNRESGRKHQFRFLQTIRGSLDTSDYADAAICFDALLFLVSRNLDTVFNERLMGRFIYGLTERDQLIFANLSNVIINTARPRTRAKALAGINLRLVSERIGGGHVPANLLTFFSENV